MNRPLYASLIAATVLLGAQVPVAVQASTLTYDVTLTALIGLEGGGGSFSISVPSNGSGVLTDNHGLTSMNVDVGPAAFGITDSAVSYTYVGSTLVLTGISGTISPFNLFSITFGSGGVYNFTDSANSSLNSLGLVSISQVSQTPLPTSLPLLATGLGALAMFGWWRKRKVGSSLAA